MLWIIDLILTGICWMLGYRLRQAYMESAHWRNEARTYHERYNAMIRAEKDTDEYRMQLYTKLSEENKKLKEQAEKDFSGLMNFSQECARHRERAAKAEATAAAFESAAKTMEEHVAAERGRADRLAAALRESEGKREQLENKFKIVENALIQCEERLGKANGENKDLKTELKKLRCTESAHPMGTVLDEMKKRGEAPVFSAAMQNNLAREFANIEAYNGTAEGQVDLTDE